MYVWVSQSQSQTLASSGIRSCRVHIRTYWHLPVISDWWWWCGVMNWKWVSEYWVHTLCGTVRCLVWDAETDTIEQVCRSKIAHNLQCCFIHSILAQTNGLFTHIYSGSVHSHTEPYTQCYLTRSVAHIVRCSSATASFRYKCLYTVSPVCCHTVQGIQDVQQQT